MTPHSLRLRTLASRATYTGNTIRFRHYDWLGSARFESNMAEQEYGDVAYAPFGETYSIKNTPYLSFTGQQQDTVSGTYDFLYREYNPVQGRWISPDPAGLAAVNLAKPQSWNRYAYVGDSPLNAVDPLGQLFEWVQGFDSNGRECRLDGFVTPCAMVQSALQADIAVNCPQCLPGQSVGADNLIYGYNPSTSQDWISPDGLYHFALTMGGWGVVGSVAANNPSQQDPLKKDLVALSEIDLMGYKISQRVLITGGMVFSGTIVAGAGIVGTVSVCATVVGCLASPITGGVALAGAGLALEGMYYGVTGKFWNPITGKSCGANGCN